MLNFSSGVNVGSSELLWSTLLGLLFGVVSIFLSLVRGMKTCFLSLPKYKQGLGDLRERERGDVYVSISHKFANQENLKVELERWKYRNYYGMETTMWWEILRIPNMTYKALSWSVHINHLAPEVAIQDWGRGRLSHRIQPSSSFCVFNLGCRSSWSEGPDGRTSK